MTTDTQQETSKKRRIGTHNGSFHCDEALACFLLHLTPEFADAEIVRSRDPKVWATCDVLVDVGAEYEPLRHRYDHHQKEFQGTFDENHKVTRLSSAGLIYKHFGKEIIQRQLKTDERQTNLLFLLIYKKFVEALDAVDNGVSQFGDAVPVYESSTSLPSRVAFLNPAWNDPNPDVDSKFKEAIQLAGREFLDCLNYYAKSWLPAKEIVEKAFHERVQLLGDERLLMFPIGCPWKDHLFDIEAETKSNPIVFVLFADQGGSWRVQGVPKFSGSFECRTFLPAEWRGLRDEALFLCFGNPWLCVCSRNRFYWWACN
eukprot:TRINITY_DN3592_c0_g2_i1.p1 TRINITY_DN3592_c0_g2~~TRINITY_DN3592_c0_g2_i1.p1  ORF type:complete len:338 (-),score=82.76 TRINITY_DN3592_c0_g2_i1:152-1096(-)